MRGVRGRAEGLEKKTAYDHFLIGPTYLLDFRDEEVLVGVALEEVSRRRHSSEA